jgi:hypothetical protein
MAKPHIDIPDHFRRLIHSYGFADTKLIDKAVATRASTSWFAILFSDGEGEFFAVDFEYFGHGAGIQGIDRIEGWEIQNDEIGPFESIKEFKNEKLLQSLF